MTVPLRLALLFFVVLAGCVSLNDPSRTGGAAGGAGSGVGGRGEAGGAGSGGSGNGGLNAIGGAATGGSSASGGNGGATGPATGGSTTGGTGTGGSATGGVATGGSATGGRATGGVATGGVATGGVATGGTKPIVTAVATLCSQNFVVLADGSVRGWNWTAATAAPSPYAPLAAVAGIKKVTGNCLEIFALTKAGTVYRTAAGSDATQVAGLSAVADITVGRSHQCALTSAHDLFCWGGNSFGQVGNGSTAAVSAPTLVTGSVAQVEAGATHTCAVTSTGGVRCWGETEDGRLGYSPTTSVTSPPAPLNDLQTIVAVILGGESTMAQRADGQYFGWGRNKLGELSIATTPVTTPTTLPSLAGATQVVSSTRDGGNFNQHYSCGIFPPNSSVRCWGNNFSGQLGNGTTTSSITPVNVPGLTNIVQLAVSSDGTTCALNAAGKVQCWGTAVGDGSGIDRLVPTDIAL